MAPTPPGRTRERVYRFVRERLLAGNPPTVREVAAAVGLSAVESARAHLEALVGERRLVKEAGLARGYRLPPVRLEGSPVAPPRLVPVLGRVRAGPLAEALLDPDGFVAVEGTSRRGTDELFALRVQGDSMVGAGIFEDDLVVVRRQPTAQDGEIVVARVGDEATVKRLRRIHVGAGAERLELHPENPAYSPIPLSPAAPADEGDAPADVEAVLLGKVIEVRRSLEGRLP